MRPCTTAAPLAALVVYDITAPESLERARYWIRELMGNSPDTLNGPRRQQVRLRVGPRGEQGEQARSLANESGLIHIEASAKEGTRVTVVFHEVAKKLASTRASSVASSSGGVVNAQGQRQAPREKDGKKKDCPC
ncbi:MAG: hypothetical protein U5N21_23575 [Rhodococcus sp. (in: high G+C Gram-positive bacteria)]|nr:hypothetical protein [Rhodococcus sp. (in: high G+C Gram-positive bacteria)]